MKKLEQVGNENIKNIYQCNDDIEYEMKFDNKFSLSSGTKDPLSVLAGSL